MNNLLKFIFVASFSFVVCALEKPAELKYYSIQELSEACARGDGNACQGLHEILKHYSWDSLCKDKEVDTKFCVQLKNAYIAVGLAQRNK